MEIKGIHKKDTLFLLPFFLSEESELFQQVFSAFLTDSVSDYSIKRMTQQIQEKKEQDVIHQMMLEIFRKTHPEVLPRQ